MKKRPSRFIIYLLPLLPLVATAHYFIFPQETRCILIRLADFEKKGNVYYRKSTPPEKINRVLLLQAQAEKRVDSFWKQHKVFDYAVIYCNDEKDFEKYGHAGAPAATQLKLGAYVVIKEESLDKDIIAHEIAHTVLYNNIGWYKTKFKIPTWFDEGLAMQVDDRDYYSVDTLLKKQTSGIKLPDISRMKSPADFHTGTSEEVMLNYSTAKYRVQEWLETHSLQKFIGAMKAGKDFETAYSK